MDFLKNRDVCTTHGEKKEKSSVSVENGLCFKHKCLAGWWLSDWSDFELRFVVLGPPISFKRAKKIIVINKHASLALTKEAKIYMDSAATQIRRQCAEITGLPIPKHIEINAAIKSYLPTKRLTDSSNLYQGVEDAMQSCRVTCNSWCRMHACLIEDDCQIRTHNGSNRLYDKNNPRVEIVLTPYESCRSKIEAEVTNERSDSKISNKKT
jgi:hypothetical protein